MSNLAKRSGDLASLLQQMKPALAQALPRHISADRIARIALTALRSNPQLGRCTPESFFGSLLQATQLGLEVNTPLGHAYLIPYKDVATLVIGYRGMLDLARRSGMVKVIYAHAVREGDEFYRELGLEPKLVHKPAEKRGDITHVYAVARLADGEPVFSVLTVADVERYRARSRAAQNGPWVTDYEPMALKTAVRRLFPWLPVSAEIARATAVDEADERAVRQVEAFSPEVQEALAVLPVATETPATAAEAPVPTEQEGRRIKMTGKSKAKAEPPKSETVPEVHAGALHDMLCEIDKAWAAEEEPFTRIDSWTPEQRHEAYEWAHAVLNDGSFAIQAKRPPHTII